VSNIYLGIDVGGSGIKAALVDLDDGSLLSERERVDTPQPATPHAIAGTIKDLVADFDYHGPVGMGFPAVIRNGTVETANNIDATCIGTRIGELVGGTIDRDIAVVNDADAAALAEARYGAAQGVPGMVLTITFGTGIGSGLLVDGVLVPNLELGQLELEGHVPAERYFSAKARRNEDLDWDQWGDRANRYLLHVAMVFSPDLMVIGGGLVKHWELWRQTLDNSLPVVPAVMGNSAGLVGAALVASSSQMA
jgi:polyphosphate glucokinase